MANCHTVFQTFNTNLNVSATALANLKRAQNSIQEHLEKSFKPLDGYALDRFKVQGSKHFGTMIRRRGEECDIDIGVYVYPHPNVKAESLLRRLHACMENYPQGRFRPTLKNKCVRVEYARNYHIDLPVYFLEKKLGTMNVHLASRREGWLKNDPRDFEKWFKERKQGNLQLVRIVRYLKSWCHTTANEERMPQGVALTALAGLSYKLMDRDDKALLHVLRRIRLKLKKEWSCKMPVAPHDELLRKFSAKDRQAFLLKLIAFIDDGSTALRAKEPYACLLWKRHLGQHFPATL